MKLRNIFLALLLMTATAQAVQPDEMLRDPQLEARARSISADLRCLVCQNQSIDDSDAELAHDLRLLVRQRLQAGDSDAAVKQYLVNRYGDYILLTPPVKPVTLLLWLSPLLFLALGVALVWGILRRREQAVKKLSAAEQGELATLLAAPPDERKAP